MKNIKKILLVGALVLAIGAGSIMAYADSPIGISKTRNQDTIIENRDDFYKERQAYRNENWTLEEREEFCEERRAIRRDELNKALENKEITEEEAREWEEHFNYMEDFRDKHRDDNIFRGNGHGRHMNARSSGFCGNGMGRGMMRGNGFRR